MPQLSYDLETPIGVDGQLIEGYPSSIESGIAQATVLIVGKLLSMDKTAGRADKAVRALAATGDVTTLAQVAGLAMWDPSYPEPPYRVGAVLPVMRKGRMLISPETALVKGTNPFIRFATGTGTVIGSFRADADTATAVAAPYITVITAASGPGALCVVEINL